MGVGGGEGGIGCGALLKWKGNPQTIFTGNDATLINFELVGEGLDGDAAELTEHNGRIYVATWHSMINPHLKLRMKCLH